MLQHNRARHITPPECARLQGFPDTFKLHPKDSWSYKQFGNLPNTHFTTKGDASRAIRSMLLNDFGLQLIFNYPQESLFEGVTQNTSIVIGVKGTGRQQAVNRGLIAQRNSDPKGF